MEEENYEGVDVLGLLYQGLKPKTEAEGAFAQHTRKEEAAALAAATRTAADESIYCMETTSSAAADLLDEAQPVVADSSAISPDDTTTNSWIVHGAAARDSKVVHGGHDVVLDDDEVIAMNPAPASTAAAASTVTTSWEGSNATGNPRPTTTSATATTATRHHHHQHHHHDYNNQDHHLASISSPHAPPLLFGGAAAALGNRSSRKRLRYHAEAAANFRSRADGQAAGTRGRGASSQQLGWLNDGGTTATTASRKQRRSSDDDNDDASNHHDGDGDGDWSSGQKLLGTAAPGGGGGSAAGSHEADDRQVGGERPVLNQQASYPPPSSPPWLAIKPQLAAAGSTHGDSSALQGLADNYYYDSLPHQQQQLPRQESPPPSLPTAAAAAAAAEQDCTSPTSASAAKRAASSGGGGGGSSGRVLNLAVAAARRRWGHRQHAAQQLQYEHPRDDDDDEGGMVAGRGSWDPMQSLAGIRHEFGEHGGVNMSIEASTTFTVMEPETLAGIFSGRLGPDQGSFFVYSRHFNPTVHALGRQLAALEGTEAAYCTASGMAAISSTLLGLCNHGDHIIASNRLYGGTYALLADLLPRIAGITTTFVDIQNIEAVRAAMAQYAHSAKVFFFETVSNPTLVVADIPALVQAAKQASPNISVVVDNTFAPAIVSPARFGADVVLHSVSKFISGASDLIAGCICGTSDFISSLMDLRHGSIMLLGATMNPHVAFQISSRLPHLGLRMAEHGRRALVLSNRLSQLGLRVVYPGLESHPQHGVLKKISNEGYGFGGVFCVDLGTVELANQFMRHLQNISEFGYLAVSLGFHETLMSCSGASTSSEMPKHEQVAVGISPGLVRISIGYTGDLEHRWLQLREAFIALKIISKRDAKIHGHGDQTQ